MVSSIFLEVRYRSRWPVRRAEFLRQRPQVRGARIFGAIDAMAETWNLLLAGQHVLHCGQRGFFVAGLEQHLDHFFVGAAMQWTLQRSNAGGHGGMNIG